MNALLALAPVNTWSFADIAIAILIFLGVCAIVWIITTKVLGFTIPPWVIQIVAICVGLLIGVIAIRFITNL